MDSETFCKTHNARAAKFGCQNCRAPMCSECRKEHSKSKTLNEHQILTIAEYLQLENFALSINNKCLEHDQILEFYCNGHQVACCTMCTNTVHQNCSNIDLLTKYVSNVKLSSFFRNMRTDVQWLLRSFETIREDRMNYHDRLKKQKSHLIEIIQNFRLSINDHLDKLEKNIVDELSREICKLGNEMETFLTILDEKRKHLKDLKTNSVNLQRYGTDLQTFHGIGILEKELEEHKQYIQCLDYDVRMHNVNIDVTFDQLYVTLPQKLSSIGKLQFRTKPNESVLYQTKARGVDDIKVKRETYIKIKSDKNRIITGCAILPGSKMVFVDYQNHLLIVHSMDGTHDRSIKLTGQPSDVAVIKDNQIAVTLWSESRVAIFDLDAGLEIRQINVNGKCYGIDFVNNRIIVSMDKSNLLQMYDTNGKLLQQVYMPTKDFAYVVQNDQLLFCSEENQNDIKCFTPSGDVIWRFRHNSMLSPHQISVDRDGFIYVSCYKSNNIFVISSDGQNGKEILDSADGLVNPSAIHISKDHNQILVCNAYSGEAHLYNLA